MRDLVKIVGMIVLMLLLASCASKNKVLPVPLSATLAVAGFSQPVHGWEVLDGHLPEDMKAVPSDAIGFMDEALALRLSKRTEATPYLGPGVVRQCREILLAKQNRSRVSAVPFWMEVGRCVSADYLLVPCIFHWQKRQGSAWGVNQPAGLMMDLYLIDLTNETLKRAHYEEVQHSLTEDIFDASTFFKRKGQWITVEQMGREGLAHCLEELGL
ncbi:MAG: hypothetical protein CSA21_05520 [Deltaproteobacteria bacterium]|nr:MAG: hypothetical protein CSA21_05520 [Deltaproteobacteria bacterium]